MRDGMINKNVIRVDLPGRRIGNKVGHPMGEPGGDRQTAGISMIFHVVHRGMSQDNGWLYLPHDPGHQTEGGQIVEDLKVIADRMMKMSTEYAGGLLRLGQPGPPCFLCVHFDRTAISSREIEVVDLESCLLQEEQCSRTEILNIIGMGKDGQGSASHRWIISV